MTALIPRTGYTLSPRRVTVNPAHVRDALQARLGGGKRTRKRVVRRGWLS